MTPSELFASYRKLADSDKAYFRQLLASNGQFETLPEVPAVARAKPVGNASDAEVVLDCIVDFCRSKNLDIGHISALRRSAVWPSFNEKVPELMKLIRSVTKRRVEQRVLMWISLQKLYEHGMPPGVAMTCTVCMGRIHQLPAMLDLAFPGYAGAGLLGAVVRQMAAQPARVRQPQSSDR